MCAPCRAGCVACFDRCGCSGCKRDCSGCCCPLSDAQRKQKLEKLRAVDRYRWFDHCQTDDCSLCRTDKDDQECSCICRRNRHIIEALSYLFKCSVHYMVSILFKLCHHQQCPIKRFPRDRAWSVMEHVKAPYTELNDLEIYDSMYDRCGLPIDPLDFDNIYKVVRMMFLVSVLTAEQQKYLLHMLQRLNANAHCPVQLDMLLQSIQGIDLKKLVCSIRNQEALTRNFYTCRQCASICRLYQRVTTIDKHSVKRDRSKRSKKYNVNNVNEHVEDVAAVRQSVLHRQFCTRKPTDSDASENLQNANTRAASIRSSRNSKIKSVRHSSATDR